MSIIYSPSEENRTGKGYWNQENKEWDVVHKATIMDGFLIPDSCGKDAILVPDSFRSSFTLAIDKKASSYKDNTGLFPTFTFETSSKPIVDDSEDAKIARMVDLFLAWPLPKSVHPDDCVMNPDYPLELSGTHLLTATEAENMIRFILKDEKAQVESSVNEYMSVREFLNEWMNRINDKQKIIYLDYKYIVIKDKTGKNYILKDDDLSGNGINVNISFEDDEMAKPLLSIIVDYLQLSKANNPNKESIVNHLMVVLSLMI